MSPHEPQPDLAAKIKQTTSIHFTEFPIYKVFKMKFTSAIIITARVLFVMAAPVAEVARSEVHVSGDLQYQVPFISFANTSSADGQCPPPSQH